MSPEQDTTQRNAPASHEAPVPPAVSKERPTEGRSRRGSERRPPRRPDRERVKPEFDQKTLDVRRVARVVAGGRRFNFSVLIVLGNRRGTVGVGTGKAGDTALAIEKAVKQARKRMLSLSLTNNRSIPYRLEAKYSSARIIMRPSPNKGLVAGSAARAVLELGGITDINAKILSGSKNKLNIARAAIKALSALKTVKTNANNPAYAEASAGRQETSSKQ